MTYRRDNGVNWGVAVATLIAVPMALGWIAVGIVGGSLVCADEAAHCAGVFWPTVAGIAVIAVGCAALGWTINAVIGAIARNR
jgi:hypothetical protein